MWFVVLSLLGVLGVGSVQAQSLCALPVLQKATLDQDCPASPVPLQVFALKNESEPMQVLLKADGTGLVDANVKITGSPSHVAVSLHRVGFFHTHATTRYAGSETGWFAEPLLPLAFSEDFPVLGGASQALWITFMVGDEAVSGNYSGVVSVSLNGEEVGSLEYQLAILPLTIPRTNDPGAFRTSFEFSDGMLDDFYPPGEMEAMKTKYFEFTQAHRFPADEIYLSKPRPVAEYEQIAALGAAQLTLLDVESVQYNGEAVSSGIRGSRVLPGRRGEQEIGCGSFSPGYVDAMLKLLEPTVVALNASGHGDKLMVYGFDEEPVECLPQVQQLFGAVKGRWPFVKTSAVLNWPSIPEGTPLDVWIRSYDQFNATAAEDFVARDGKYENYWCIEPSQPGWLNSFIERPLHQARLLSWLSFLQSPVSGLLYYATDLWLNFSPTIPFWSNYTLTPSSLTYPLPHEVVRPVNGSDPRLQLFDVSNWIWAPRTDIFANGDGAFFWPGAEGPITSIRYETLRDGIEDIELFKLLTRSTITPLLHTVITNGTNFTQSPQLVMDIRAKIATMAMKSN